MDIVGSLYGRNSCDGFLPRPPKRDDEVVVEQATGPIEALKGAAKLFVTKDMLLLSTTFFYTGINRSKQFTDNEYMT